MKRRDFVVKTALSVIGVSAASNSWALNQSNTTKKEIGLVPLGMDAHSVRGMRWNASQLIAYANQLQMDTLLLNGLNYFESLEDGHLKSLKKQLDENKMQLYFGVGGLSTNSTSYSAKLGPPKELIQQGIRVAKIFNSKSVNCRIGSIADRYTDGGIVARMEEIIHELRSMRSQIQDAGIKFAVENHAGDMRSEEVLSVVETVGPDICGVMLDPGNSVWAMENPMQQIKTLSKHVLCTSVRDYKIWESENGATFQWTAVGDGSMDMDEYTRILSELCPGVPLNIESISGKRVEIPFLQDDFWEGYPELKAEGLLDFYKMIRQGEPMDLPSHAEESDVQEQQQKELIKSIDFLRTNCAAVSKLKK
jgi:sugar phosphate isomerase/epimerase